MNMAFKDSDLQIITKEDHTYACRCTACRVADLGKA
jgi:redox-regulated HSP33 family molecular chaperone